MGADHNTGRPPVISELARFPGAGELANLPRMSKRALGGSRFSACGRTLWRRLHHSRRRPPPPTARRPAPRRAPAPRPPSAAENRIANLSRVDLLGGAGVGAFKLEGEVAEGRPRADRRDRAAVHRRRPRDDQGGLGPRVGGAAGSRRTAPPIEAGDAILATFYLRTETPAGGGRRRDRVRVRAQRLALHQVGAVPGAGGAAGWSKVAGPLQGGGRLRRRRGARPSSASATTRRRSSSAA